MIDTENIKPFNPPLPLQTERGVYNYMSTPNIYGLIRFLCEYTGGPYLEIGSYRGMSLLAAGSGTGIKCIGVDNFTGVGYRADNKEILLEQIKPFKNIELLEADYLEAFSVLKKKRRKFGVIFLDGPHDIEGTAKQINGAAGLIKKNGFIIVDDFSKPEVNVTTLAYIEDPNLKLELIATKRVEGGKIDPEWWRGIAVIQKQ